MVVFNAFDILEWCIFVEVHLVSSTIQCLVDVPSIRERERTHTDMNFIVWFRRTAESSERSDHQRIEYYSINNHVQP